jgi:hypothetical protein
MNKKAVLFLIISLYCTPLKSKIKHILIDPNVIFTTNNSKAAGYVGKWESLKYTAATGHLPSQKHFFDALRTVPATSSVITYDETFTAPLIISDWLLGFSTSDLKTKIKKFLDSSSMSKPEKNVYTNTVNMMFDGTSLAKVQKVRNKVEKLLKQLKQAGYKIYFAGNWTKIEPLKKAFPKIFAQIDGVCISSDIKLLKPEIEFWETVWASQNLTPEECLCIEAEPKFYQTASQSQLPCKTVLYQHKDFKRFCNDLKKVGVSVSL